jgi:hypothetical protein
MNWKSIRLELARTERFPQGSASRSYLLRLPLLDDGQIDAPAINETPAHAIVRRFWPNEPDRIGAVVPTPDGFALAYEAGAESGAGLLHLEPHPIRLGACVTLPEPDGTTLPFRVASMRQVR